MVTGPAGATKFARYTLSPTQPVTKFAQQPAFSCSPATKFARYTLSPTQPVTKFAQQPAFSCSPATKFAQHARKH